MVDMLVNTDKGTQGYIADETPEGRTSLLSTASWIKMQCLNQTSFIGAGVGPECRMAGATPSMFCYGAAIEYVTSPSALLQ